MIFLMTGDGSKSEKVNFFAILPFMTIGTAIGE